MAEQLTDYTKTNWAPGMPITLVRMNHIENLIDVITDNLLLLITDFGNLDARVGTGFDTVALANKTITAAIDSVYGIANTASVSIGTIRESTQNGQKAWELLNRITYTDANGVSHTIGALNSQGTFLDGSLLTDYLNMIITSISDVANTIGGDYSSSNTVASTLSSILAEFDTGGDVYQIIDEILNARGLKNYTTGKPAASSLKDKLDDIESLINKNTQNINDNLLDVSGDYASLNARLDSYEDIKEEVETARGKDKNNDNYENLNARLNNMLTKDDIVDDTATANVNKVLSANAGKTLQDDINDIDSNYSAQIRNATTSHTGTYKPTNLDTRFANIDGGSQPSRTLPSVITEINNAHREVEEGQPADTLNLRFSDLDSAISHAVGHSGANDKGGLTERIGELESTVSPFTSSSTIQTALNNKLNKSLVTDNFNVTSNTGGDIYKVLHAHAGYTLNQKIDHEKDVNDENDKGGLTQRIEALEGEIDVTSANSRVDVAYTEVTTARTSSVITDTHTEEVGGETVTTQVPHTYASVDARLEAIETHAAAARTDINTIAGELAMVDHENIVNTNTRVDTLENDLRTMATELNMIDGTTIRDTNTRIDSIEDEINAAHRNDVTNDTLDNRFDAAEGRLGTIESDLNTTSTGLKARITTAESDIDTLEAELNTASTGIKARLTVAEGDIDALEAELDTATTGVKARITALETTVDTAETGLTARMGAAESRLDAIDTASTGALDVLDGRIDALETTIDTANTGLSDRMATAESAISHAASGNDPGGLTERIATLENEPKSATTIITSDCITYNDETGLPTIYTDSNKTTIITPSTDVDYLLLKDDKYYYWKYIQTATSPAAYSWELISGGGGSGTGSSSGRFITSLTIFEGDNAETPDPNTDYFVGNNTIGYTHYRYLIPDGSEIGTFVRILPKGLLLNASVNANGGLVAGTVENPSSNVFNTFVALKSVDSEVVTDTNGNPAGTKLTFVDTNGISYPITVEGGGGGGSAYTVKLSNETGALQLTVPDIEGTITNLSARAIVKEGADIATNLSSVLTVVTQYSASSSGPWTTLDTRTVENNTSFSVNISNILRTGVKMYVRMTLTTRLDEQDYVRPINFEVTKVEMSINAINFNPATVRTGNLVFLYKCIGSDLIKTVHFKIDGVDAVTPVVTDSHNEPLQLTISLAGKSVGMHSFEVYFTVNNVPSNILNYYILYNPDTSNTLPMIALAAEKATITYGDELKINYTTAVNTNVESMDDVQLELYTVDNNVETIITSTELTNVRNEEVHSWIPIEYPLSGTAYIRGIASRTVNGAIVTDTKTIQITINELVTDYNLTYAGTDNLLYSYTAYGRTNHDVGKEQYTYTYTSHDVGNPELTWTGTFNNFNWSTDGYADGESLIIGGGATHTIDLPIFESKKNNVSLEIDASAFTDPTLNGRTIEIEYEVQSATDLNDVIIDCMDNNHVGFRVTPQSCYLLNNNVDISFANDGTGTILNEDAIAAAYLTTGVRTHLTFVIEPWAAEKAYDRKYHQSVNIYLNGEFANACPYNRDNSTGNISDSFKTNATIRIGSASCIIKLYSIKMYNRGLTHTEVLQNYKMAPGKTLDKLVRFDKNNVLKGGKVDYELARKKFNCLLLVGPEPVIQLNAQGQNYNAMPTISPYKGAPSPIGRSKDGEVVGKTESGLILTYPDGNIDGYKTEFNLCDIMTDGGYASSNNVQGTSSQKYPIHNLKIYLMKGTEGQEELDENEQPTGRYKKSEKVKYKLPGSKGKGESTLCWKADYMSTDHANTYNANIADSLFTDSLNPDITNEAWQSGILNTVHGIRCLLFKQEGNNAPEFVADGCLNNDKGNSKTYGLEYTGDDGANTTAQKWEFTNNSDDLGFFKYDCVFYPTGNDQHYRALDAFESCFPDLGDLEDAQDAYKAANNNVEDPNLNPNYNHLLVLLTWVSQRANYWDETNPTLRAQKKEIFRTEFTRHFNLDHVLVYYLFSEYTALCDNRVKNMFMRSDTIRSERIKLLNGTTIFEGNDNPNADYWKSFIDVQTTEVNQQAIINTIAAVYSDIHELEEVTTPDYAETVVGQVVADAGASTLTLAQLQARIVSYLNEEEAVVGAGYMAASTGNEYVVEHRMSHATDIDWEEGEEHSQFARWAPVLYDLDSCFGVENVGLLKIPYNADWLYFSEGQYRFNGHDSVFWLMVEDTFATELAAKALTLYNRSRGLNYSTFYQELVVDNNEETAPAMTNQDMLLKFDAPWATGFMNYANKPPTYETPEYKYLQRGTRAAQKTSFLFKRSMLLSSKYQASAFLNDKISFRYGADLTANQAVIECSANQIMYPAVSFGDNKGWTQALELTNGTPVVGGLVNAGETCRIRATSSAKGLDTLFIAGASVLTDIGDLSVFKPYELKVGQGKNLKKLIIGSNTPGYTNAVTNTIENLSACSILEEINIRNCTAFTLLDVSANGLIKRIYAAGSGAGTISLPSGGVLETIEYSAVTANITILNHGTLQNFSFEVEEGESEPTYSNLNKLWVENTPNVPIVDIIIKRLGGLTNGVRLINIDIDLGNDPTFLQTITSTLAEGKKLDSTGSLNTNLPPEITGKVHINEIRASLLTKLNLMYPNLIIYNVMDAQGNVSNNIIAEYTVEYRNYDNTLLYTDNRTNTENYIDPVFDTNPITGEPYIPVPTRPADAQYIYRFGTYRNNKYQRYSGWVRKGTNTNPNSSMTVGGNTIFTAVYPTTEDQYYTVTWYDKYNGTARQELSVKYGTDLSSEPSPIEQGTLAKTDRSGNQVKVFNGWSRPLGKIEQDTNVYALWLTSTIDDDTEDIDMSILTAADIYALSLVSNEKKAELLSDKLGTPIFIQMGQDFNYNPAEGVDVINLLGAESTLLFDGSTDDVRVYNNITPLSVNRDWTLAIDYKFLMDSEASFVNSPEFVLASCYKEVGSTINGFKLSLKRNINATPTIEVSWGTETITIDYAVADTLATRYFTSYRNVLVLSHNSNNQNELRVSYVLPSSSNSNAPAGASCGTFVSNTLLTYTSSLIDTPLIFGGNYVGATTNYENSSSTRAPAQGIIYWAKFWDTDLGETNCSKLASWPHETVPFYLTGFNGTNEESNKNELIYNNSELSFVAAQGMGDRYLYSSTSGSEVDSNGRFGWHLSNARSLCNNVIYQGMPEVYKSIIRLSTIQSAARDPYANLGVYVPVDTQDYLFFPTYREVYEGATSGGTYGNEVRTLWASPWSWMVAADKQILKLLSGSNQVLEYTNATSINAYRYRFSGAYIANTAKIFDISFDPTSRNLSIARPGQSNESVTVVSGDVWIRTTQEETAAYMYFTNEQIELGITVDLTTSNGGWKRCDRWNLRTYSAEAQTAAENLFLRVQPNGNIEQNPTTRGDRDYGRLLCPEFTV